MVTWEYNLVRLRVEIQHGSNGEAVLIIDDVDVAKEGVEEYVDRVKDWIERVHDYEDRQTGQASPE
jgi:hypothetical protein